MGQQIFNFTRKGAINILDQAKEYPKTWSELKTDVSSRTQDKRLKEAQEAGHLSKVNRANGKEAYSITPKGKEALERMEEVKDFLKG